MGWSQHASSVAQMAMSGLPPLKSVLSLLVAFPCYNFEQMTHVDSSGSSAKFGTLLFPANSITRPGLRCQCAIRWNYVSPVCACPCTPGGASHASGLQVTPVTFSTAQKGASYASLLKVMAVMCMQPRMRLSCVWAESHAGRGCSALGRCITLIFAVT